MGVWTSLLAVKRLVPRVDGWASIVRAGLLVFACRLFIRGPARHIAGGGLVEPDGRVVLNRRVLTG
jgi:hypothetical protein